MKSKEINYFYFLKLRTEHNALQRLSVADFILPFQTRCLSCGRGPGCADAMEGWTGVCLSRCIPRAAEQWSLQRGFQIELLNYTCFPSTWGFLDKSKALVVFCMFVWFSATRSRSQISRQFELVYDGGVARGNLLVDVSICFPSVFLFGADVKEIHSSSNPLWKVPWFSYLPLLMLFVL